MKKAELKIYELLGVRVFRGLVFKLEKLIHRNDQGRNTNYHIASYDPSSIDDFIKYLFYNGAIHVRNILFMVLLFGVRYFIFKTLSAVDILLWLIFTKDCYCVMLQRYNFLRIQIRKEQIQDKYEMRIEKKGRQLIVQTATSLSNTERENCLEFVKTFSHSIATRNCVVIGEKDIEVLLSLKKVLTIDK